MKFRRAFLINAPLGLLAVVTASRAGQTPPPPGAPPTFGASAAVGPEVSPATFAEAEKLVQVSMTPAQRAMAARSWRVSMASMQERRSGPRTLALASSLAPASQFDPLAVAGTGSGAGTGTGTASGMGSGTGARRERFVRSAAAPGPLPARDEDIAFAPVTRLSRWIASRALSSERLTRIYIERIKRLDPKLRSVITLTETHALAQARQADREIAAGKYRGPLHGIPYGVKDLLDTAGIATTWGAEPDRKSVV